ncbi:hypothetical protein ACFQFH_00495 [Halobaculum halobium]|uniref:hypothetical protein n=1 Tax=Halobaculum halobium TaxID=3032281 RepID=UPI0036161825
MCRRRARRLPAEFGRDVAAFAVVAVASDEVEALPEPTEGGELVRPPVREREHLDRKQNEDDEQWNPDDESGEDAEADPQIRRRGAAGDRPHREPDPGGEEADDERADEKQHERDDREADPDEQVHHDIDECLSGLAPQPRPHAAPAVDDTAAVGDHRRDDELDGEAVDKRVDDHVADRDERHSSDDERATRQRLRARSAQDERRNNRGGRNDERRRESDPEAEQSEPVRQVGTDVPQESEVVARDGVDEHELEHR